MEQINQKFNILNESLELEEKINITINTPQHQEFCQFLTENSCLSSLYLCESCWKFIAYKLIKIHQSPHHTHKILTKTEISNFDKFKTIALRNHKYSAERTSYECPLTKNSLVYFCLVEQFLELIQVYSKKIKFYFSITLKRISKTAFQFSRALLILQISREIDLQNSIFFMFRMLRNFFQKSKIKACYETSEQKFLKLNTFLQGYQNILKVQKNCNQIQQIC